MLYAFGGKAPQVDPTAFVSASAELIGDVIVGPRCYIGPLPSSAPTPHASCLRRRSRSRTASSSTPAGKTLS